uniref:UBA domain-containing protein n=1 Tax=Globisporangium ultimum (strain ATCC 200006 / CBS 805.95 / DAOM BR144) TaxID=431595 RepID=K3X1Q2_GLOUD
MSSPAIAAPEAHSPPKKPAHPKETSSPETATRHQEPQNQASQASVPPPKQQPSAAATSPPQQQQQQAGQRTTTSASITKPAGSGDGEAGDVVGEYVLGETIGKGTFGKVKIGLHLVTGEKVAIKILEKKRIVQVADVERSVQDLIRRILETNPEKRLTVELIRQHPWFTSMRAVLSKSLAERDDLVIKKMIFTQLESLGMEKAVVVDALHKKAHNNITASYYLLYSKFVRRLKDSSNASTSSGQSQIRNISNGASAALQHKRLDHIDESKGKVNSPRPSAPAKKVGSVGAMSVEGTLGGVATSSGQSSHHGDTGGHRRHTTHPPSPAPPYRDIHVVQRAVTPSGASPRISQHQQQQPPAAATSPLTAAPQPRRPSSVRSGRNLVMLNTNGGYQPVVTTQAMTTANGSVIVRRPSAPIAPKANNSHGGGIPSSRVSVSNGMVALTPLAHHPHRGKESSHASGNPSHQALHGARRHTVEVPHHHLFAVLKRLQQGPLLLAQPLERQAVRR